MKKYLLIYKVCKVLSQHKQCYGSGSGVRCFFTSAFGIRIRDGKKSGSVMNIPNNFSESLETVFRVKNS
jgi:hypothetical protein